MSEIKTPAERRQARIANMIAGAKDSGINLNYSPEIVFDTMKVSNEEWQESMKNGIGASEAGAVMGCSPYSSPRNLTLKKLGLLKDEKITPGKQFVFDYGHQMEQALLNYEKNLSGLKTFTDRNRYRHPLYPFMFCDLDGVEVDEDSMKTIIECKTTSLDMIVQWKSGVLGYDGILPVESYIWQATHQMAVMNLDRVKFLAAAGNSESLIREVIVYRDFKREKKLIEEENALWQSIQKGIIPEIPESISDEEYKAERTRYKYPTKEVTEEVKSDLLNLAEEMQYLEEQEKSAKAVVKEILEHKNAVKLSMIEGGGLKNGDVVEIVDADGNIHKISYKANKPTEKTDLDALRLQNPELYEELKDSDIIKVEEHDPVLKHTVKKPKAKKAK